MQSISAQHPKNLVVNSGDSERNASMLSFSLINNRTKIAMEIATHHAFFCTAPKESLVNVFLFCWSLDEEFNVDDFDKTFGHDVIVAAYVGYNDKRFLLESYKRAGVEWKFDYHYFDIWGLFYTYLAMQNQLQSKKDFAGFGMEFLMKKFNIEIPTTLHDALTDCRCEAEVLRRVIQALK